MNRVSLQIKIFISAIIYLYTNYFISNIPCWIIRRLLYRMLGMRIGKNSRINMKCIVVAPWRIRIGERTIINEYCYLDGRGGLEIGNDTSISIYSIIFSASHDSSSQTYAYIKEKTVIKNNVWLGARSIVHHGSTIESRCILSAGSSLKGETEAGYIYTGIPARKRRYRGLKEDYKIDYKDYFR